MNKPFRIAVVATCLGLSATGALAAEADTASAPAAAMGLQVRSIGPLPGAAVVDFALPSLTSLLRSAPQHWLRDAALTRSRLSPSWRLGDNSGFGGSGLRASAGVVQISRAAAYGSSSLNEQIVVDTLPRLGSTNFTGATPVTASAPYVGIGWREAPVPSTSGGGAWGFNADVGLLALAPRSAVRFGRSAGGPLTLDDMVRDLRFTPMLQVGVTYAF